MSKGVINGRLFQRFCRSGIASGLTSIGGFGPKVTNSLRKVNTLAMPCRTAFGWFPSIVTVLAPGVKLRREGEFAS